MSLSTTCTLFWADVHGIVVSASNETAICDNTYTQCQITPKQPVPSGPARQLHATCDSRPHFPHDGYPVSTSRSEYFCVCHGRAVSVPPGVTCTSSCYTLNTRFSDCALITLYYDDGGMFAATQYAPGNTQFRGSGGNPNSSQSRINRYKESCTAFNCDTTGVNCTKINTGGGGGNGELLYICDNYKHHPKPDFDSADSYVCNCHGAATIPSIYTGTGKDIQSKDCWTGSDDNGKGTKEAEVGSTSPAVVSTHSAASSRDGDRAKTSSSRNFSIVTAVILLTRQWRRL
ncbi:hypothetical protein PG989_015084 [Apiospora arundinis]